MSLEVTWLTDVLLVEVEAWGCSSTRFYSYSVMQWINFIYLNVVNVELLAIEDIMFVKLLCQL